jgi:hypothetical protein
MGLEWLPSSETEFMMVRRSTIVGHVVMAGLSSGMMGSHWTVDNNESVEPTVQASDGHSSQREHSWK